MIFGYKLSTNTIKTFIAEQKAKREWTPVVYPLFKGVFIDYFSSIIYIYILLFKNIPLHHNWRFLHLLLGNREHLLTTLLNIPFSF